MNFRVLDNPAVCKRCGTASQVMLLDGVCGACLTRKDVDMWLNGLSMEEESLEALPDDTEELRKRLRETSAMESVGDDVLIRAGADAIGKKEWLEEHLSAAKKDHELCRLLERAGAGDVKSGRQAIRRISIYHLMWNGELSSLLSQLKPALDGREEALFKIAGSRRRESVRNDAVSKIMAGRKLEISFD